LGLPNNKIIADAYAASGEYLVLLPDFFKGDPVGLKIADALLPVNAAAQSTFAKYTGMLASLPTFLMWQRRHGKTETEKVCFDFLRELRRATPSQRKIGMVGFCWGGRFALRAGLESSMMEIDGVKKPLVDAIVALHPSNMVLPEDVDNLVVPTSIAWGVEDSMVSFETKSKVEEIHAKVQKTRKEFPQVEHRVYKPGRHGFAVRGNPDDPQERKALEDTEKQVLAWFEKWL
jgi:dienelactone hydrolase